MPPSAASCVAWPSPLPPNLIISQGVTMTATKKEKIMAAEAVAGMGLM